MITLAGVSIIGGAGGTGSTVRFADANAVNKSQRGNLRRETNDGKLSLFTMKRTLRDCSQHPEIANQLAPSARGAHAATFNQGQQAEEEEEDCGYESEEWCYEEEDEDCE